MAPHRSFPVFSRILHWTMAVLVLAMLFIGIGMVSSVSAYHQLVAIHKPLGILVLVLVAIRLVNRLVNPPPPLPEGMPPWQRVAALGSHVLLYVLMFAVPIVGWAMLSAARYPVVLYGALQLPPIMPQNPELFAVLRETHTVLALLLFVTFLAHFGAALMHALIFRDDVFPSMTFWGLRNERAGGTSGDCDSARACQRRSGTGKERVGGRTLLWRVPGERSETRQLLCLLNRHVGFPVAHDGVEDDQELSGDGNEGELCRFAGLSQLCVEGLEVVGAADGVEGGHVEGITDTLAPAADLTLAAVGTAVDVEGSQARKRRGLLRPDMPEFRHLRDELHAGHGTHTGQRAHQLCIVRDLRLCLDQGSDVGLDLFDLAVENLDKAANAFGHGSVIGFTATVLLLGSHEDQLIPPFCQSRQGVAGRRRDLLSGGPHGAREGGEHPCVDRVSFGELAAGTGKVASPGRIDPGEADVGLT